MAGLVDSRTGEHIDLEKGNKLHHWRFGPLNVENIENGFITVTLVNPEGIVKVLDKGTNERLLKQTKKFKLDSLGKWLFSSEEEISESLELFPSLLHSNYDANNIEVKVADNVQENE